MTTFAFAFFLSLGLPTALIFTRNALNNKVINADEIKDIVDIPIIAELSLERSDNSIAIKEKFTSAMSEQIRGLRTKLHYLHKPKEKGRVTLITSSIPGEGKSFLSTNLAVALAYTERKTIILELDMRKPKIAEAFSLEKGHAGLSDYFERKVSIESIIQDSGILPNLQIISSGSEIYNPSELLEREELSHLLAHLRYVYDDIIIDSPPAHLVPDATIVSPLSDLCLYIVRQGFTEKSELKFLNTLIEQEQLSKVNIVFNGIEQNRYGYGYSYNNNYYNNQKKSFFSNVFGDFKSRF
ncbi:tyrosine-protein kinase family protein [Pedobacter fastidiosus]|uniref:non-specific protein-tyrosine kinase n=1 Tax=Pedobacter fastidiosus TaxID=2765361 RepID=A0ABR7KV93_9SPHI|nr:CpsD/CapB family tyrosine-protein kinase [Pedobacter fastidiosus]MBC6111849.1 CpsD/CapB family tyrosine-protein kinase [Pedobacter fastidiosus]